MNATRALLVLLVSTCYLSSDVLAQTQVPAEVVVNGPVGERIHRYLQWGEAFGFSGAVLIALDGKILLHNAYGLADRKTGRRNMTDTVFSFGSIAKQFTGAGIMKLAQEGKLDVQDPIGRYLDGVPADKTEITIHQLLNHTSGLLNSISLDDFLVVSREEAVRRTLNAELVAIPGTEFRYSNAGVSLAAAVIEVVSGQEYRAFLREHIFEPAGMTRVGFMGEDRWPADKVARIYSGPRDNGSPNEFPGPFWVLLGNGGVVTTVGEMYLWHRALQGNDILTAESKRAIFTPDPPDLGYGYGWDVAKTKRNTKRYGHDGGSSLGLSAQFFRFPDEDGAMIFASNGTIGRDRAISVLTQPIYRAMFEDWISLPVPPGLRAPGPSELRSLTGVYAFESAGEFSVRRLSSELFGYLVGQDLLEVVGVVAEKDRESFRVLNRKAVAVIDGVYQGKLGLLEEVLGSEERVPFWAGAFESWADSRGAYKEVQILGTRRVWEHETNEPVTWLRAFFDRGSQLFRIHWEGERFAARGGQAWPAPMYGPIRFTDNGSAVLFQFDTAKFVGLEFSRQDSGKADSVTLRTRHESPTGHRK